MRTQPSPWSGIDMRQFHAVFFEEAGEHLAGMASLLVGIDSSPPRADVLDAMFRAAHSINGGAGTFGFADLAKLAHGMETLLDRVRQGRLAFSPAVAGVLLAANDALGRQLAVQRGEGGNAPEVSALVAHLRSLCAGPPAEDDRAARFSATTPGALGGEPAASPCWSSGPDTDGEQARARHGATQDAAGHFDALRRAGGRVMLLAEEEDEDGAYGLFAASGPVAAAAAMRVGGAPAASA